MADMERSLLYIGIGFIGTLFIMKSVRALRPASASAMYNQTLTLSSGHNCTSCKNDSIIS